MGWELPDLAPMVCDCCAYRVVVDWDDSDIGSGPVKLPSVLDYGFRYVEDPKKPVRSQLWCDDCALHWGRFNWDGRPAPEKEEAYKLFQRKRRELAAVRMAEELNELAAKLLKFKVPDLFRQW
jgi:hypothetical protein|tara:strand:+ start:964 stop:1332 length:369 start_codon:yes stop_codon:yes gene_type:complete